jgi:hypothetical protein
MAITFNIAKCKNGWGVYVRAISGDDLKFLSPSTEASVVRVTSGRLARKRSKQSAKNYITKIQNQSFEEQHRLLSNTWIKIAPSEYQVIRVQNLRLFREISPDKYIPLFTTVNKTYAEKVALYYPTERDKQSFLRKTTTKYIKLPLNINTDNLNKI